MNILYYVCLLVTGYFDLHNIEPRLLPVLHMPYSQLVQPLKDLWLALKYCTQHIMEPALFTLGAVAMNMHFQILSGIKRWSSGCGSVRQALC